MNIACATDNNYAPYCGIMLTSLFENNKNHSFSVYILSQGLSEEHCSKFDTLAKRYNSEIIIVEIDNTIFSNCRFWALDHVTVATFYRLLLPTVLPKDMDRVLYLDCDIIVNHRIDELYMQDMDNVPLCACVNIPFCDDLETRLGIKNEKYFNAGVLLINLSYWRTNHIFEKCLDIINSIPDKLIYHDQDTLNLLFHCEQRPIKFLDITYNFQTACIKISEFNDIPDDIKRNICQCAYYPTIIHFISNKKPWLQICADPYKPRFLYFRRKSLWADTPLQKNYETLRQYLGWQRRLFEMKIGMRKPWYMSKRELRKIAKSQNTLA